MTRVIAVNCPDMEETMTKEVLLTLQGLQFDQREENADQIETVTVGDYYKKNDRHYVVYEEVTEGFDRATKNRLKFGGQMVELTRHGLVVDVDYALDINYEFLSDCHIKIDIRSKENSSFTLLS